MRHIELERKLKKCTCTHYHCPICGNTIDDLYCPTCETQWVEKEQKKHKKVKK